MSLSIRLENQEKGFIDACIARERWAQKQLYEENYSMLMGVCLRYSSNQDDAMDILHEGFSHKEIAEMLEITESTSRSNLVKARTKLKDLLAVTLGSNGK